MSPSYLSLAPVTAVANFAKQVLHRHPDGDGLAAKAAAFQEDAVPAPVVLNTAVLHSRARGSSRRRHPAAAAAVKWKLLGNRSRRRIAMNRVDTSVAAGAAAAAGADDADTIAVDALPSLLVLSRSTLLFDNRRQAPSGTAYLVVVNLRRRVRRWRWR